MTLTHHNLSKNCQYVFIGKICYYYKVKNFVLNLQLNIDTYNVE